MRILATANVMHRAIYDLLFYVSYYIDQPKTYAVGIYSVIDK